MYIVETELICIITGNFYILRH